MLSTIFLFLNFGAGEIALILFVALILFGGDKFPEIARALGKGMREFRDMSDGVKREIHQQIDNYDSNHTPSKSAVEQPTHNMPDSPPVSLSPEVTHHVPAEPMETVVNPTHETIETPVVHTQPEEHTSIKS